MALLSLTWEAHGAEVSSDCPRLTQADGAELEARARLTLHAAAGSLDSPRSVVVHCDGQSAWIEWRAQRVERLPVDERAGLLEGAIQAIELRLEPDRPSRPEDAASPAPFDIAPPDPTFPEPRDSVRPAPDGRSHRTGGLALAVRAGPEPGALGPELALGLGWRGLAFSSSESLLFGDSFTLFALRFGVGYGAPYTRRRWLGAHTFGGWQGLAGTGTQARANVRTTGICGIIGAAVRASRTAGPGVVFIGADLTYRLRRLAIDPSFDVALPRWQPELVVGWAVVE